MKKMAARSLADLVRMAEILSIRKNHDLENLCIISRFGLADYFVGTRLRYDRGSISS
jgi:hypothetical protein